MRAWSLVSRAEANYAFLADKANEAQIKLSQGRNIGYLQVIDPASLPGVALPKRTLQLLIVGIIVSLLIAVILAFILEALEVSLGRSQPQPSASEASAAASQS